MSLTPTPPSAALPGLAGVRAEVEDRNALRRDDVITGDAVRLDLRPATLPIRVTSGLIDALVLIIVLVLVTQVTSRATWAMEPSFQAAVSLVLFLLVVLITPTVVETLSHGRSLGKVLLGLRVVRDDAGPIRMRHAMIRALTGLIELWFSAGGIAAVTSLLNRRAKRLGDLMAGSYVVVERPPKQKLVVVQMPPELAGWAAGTDLARIPDPTAAAARQLLGRLDKLTSHAAYALLQGMSAELSRYVAPGPPPHTPPDRFIAAVLAERRRRDYERLVAMSDTQRQRRTAMHTLPFGLE